jgi:hypothetical protein
MQRSNPEHEDLSAGRVAELAQLLYGIALTPEHAGAISRDLSGLIETARAIGPVPHEIEADGSFQRLLFVHA